MGAAIVAEGISKTYNGKVRAVENVSFTVESGEAYGFLGPNGAGKTTTVSMLTAQLAPTDGRATVDGIDVFANPADIKKRIGLVFQESTADSDLTGRENLELAAALFAVPRKEVTSRIDSLLERMQIGEAADRLAKTYSGGMRRRLELAVGIIHSPRVLFLDEPTLGLDPQGRAGFWRYVEELRKEHGMTVFLTTHYLEEADGICERLAIIDHGHIVATGSPSELKDRLGGDVITIRPTRPEPTLEGVLKAVPGVTSVGVQDGAFRVKAERGEELIPTLVAACSRAGVGLAGVSLKRPSLDEVFLEFTGREYREDESVSATDRAVRVGQVQQAFGRARR
ncbi:MAG: ATP-binding cassette domain-containing protein [Thermoplasmata archaeon]|jgi:ABC-2 type transport system ATP-binding protein|nr:ATP-binding cassette domain-containing protein [Thermoplasmata archaeon]